MKPTQQQPRDSLLKLVEYVFDHRDGLIQGVTYETLAMRIPAHRGHSFRCNVGTDSGTIVGSDSG